MEIELKRIKFSEHLSEETNAFTANLYVNGRHVGYVENRGHGGNTNYSHLDAHCREIIKAAEEHAKTLPAIDYGDFSVDSNLENLIDRIFESWLSEKELKKNSRKGVYYRHPENGEMIITWKGWTVPKMLGTDHGRRVLKETVKRLKSEGCEILNNNMDLILDA
jgi:hypothetical protein